MTKHSKSGKKVSTMNFRLENSFEWTPITDKVCVFKRGVVLLCNDERDRDMLSHLLDTKKTSTQGFCTTENAIAFAAGTISDIPSLSDLQYVDSTFMLAMREKSFPDVLLTYSNAKKEWALKDPFDAWMSGDQRPEDVLNVDYSSYVVRDLDKKVLSTAIPCNSTSGSFTDRKYNLEKLIPHLQQDPRVRFHNPLPRRPAAVNHIYESYSRDTSFSYHTSFTIYLDQSTYNKVLEKSRTYNKRNNNYVSYDDLQRAMFDMDVLGVHANGIAHYQDYYYSPPDDESLSP